MKRLFASVLFVASVLFCLPGCMTPQQQTEVIGAISNAVADVVNHNPSNGPTPVVVPTNAPAPVVVPMPTDPATNAPGPTPVTGAAWRGCLFTKPTAFENSNGAASQMNYRGSHGEGAKENDDRKAMVRAVAAMGGNVTAYIIGKSNRVRNDVLDLCLCGRKHPDGTRWLNIQEPTPEHGEVDWAMWAARDLGITHHLAWIWNDDNSMPVTEATVIAAVATYAGTRLGMENVAFGVCLESNEIMPAQQAAQALAWIRKAAPQSRAVVGSSSADYLLSVAALAPAGCYYWLEAEASGNPITDPCNPGNLRAKILNKSDKVAAKVGKSRVICGELWGATDADRLENTRLIEAAGYECGSGQWK